MNTEQASILRIVARDIENLLLPAIASPSLRFVGGAMKTLLERIAYTEASAFAASTASSDDWNALITWTEAEDQRQLAGEQTSRSDGWAQSGSGQVKSSGSAACIRTKPIEPEALLHYLHGRVGFEWVREASVDQAPGGFSKDTFLVRLSGEGGRRSGMVLRRDQVFRPLLTSVADEAGVLTTLSQAGLPVPTPLWVESDPQHFGAAVLATSWIEGSADEKRWSADPVRAQLVLADAAQLLARLHAFPLDGLSAEGSGVPGSRGDSPAAMVEDIRVFWERIRPAPNPLMERVLDWLPANAPEGFARHAIVHSDFGFHNLMVNDDRVVGLLDWEFWHIGDPREDLAYTRSFVERVMPWDDFRKLYEAAGGVASDPRTDRFYSVLGGVRVAMGCYALQHAVSHEPERLDSKMVYVGQSFANRFLIDAARVAAIAEST